MTAVSGQEQELKVSKDVWVFAEQKDGQLAGVVYELLGPGRQLAGKLGGRLTAVLFGADVAAAAEELLSLGVDVVYKVDDPSLAHYNSWLYPRLLEKLVRDDPVPPHSLLIGATYAGMDLAPATAARLGAGCAAHCVRLDLDEQGNLLQGVPGFGGAVLATVVSPFTRPQIATVKPGVFAAPDSAPGATPGAAPPPSREAAGRATRGGEMKEIAFPFSEAAPVKVLAVKKEEFTGAPLEKAAVVVAGGAGVGSREGWAKIEELASLLGAAVGATRPAVDAGWAQEARMIGQSGKTVRPRLYIGIGISGDIQHTVGIQDADKIVAINANPKAPIFKMADYGVAADFQEIIPLLCAAVVQVKRTQAKK